ncbi:hypothetical protein T4B_14185 [Trichinella pseudospiralis]|uniref:Uncharacterized protein n=2 Tax=Trichinella pseudospiralis TaxID=6337 RepID=A0A0V1K3L4_TRIPS|nr:hypothetical protein T4D_11856 [Trichinella pseudospiralis]KRZ21258.1 hypothetical protein T4B_14185 [Trichinella pseudospiralis]KRZ41833.1 hypothetical protein T4C_4157 [Trichinella pseudospiralis]
MDALIKGEQAVAQTISTAVIQQKMKNFVGVLRMAKEISSIFDLDTAGSTTDYPWVSGCTRSQNKISK